MSKLIIIDHGHGGSDPGALGKLNGGTVTEAKINYNVGQFLATDLQKQGFRTAFTQTTDETKSIYARCQTANQLKGDLLVSVHHNAGGGQGYEVIHSVHGGDSKKLALLVATEFAAIGQTKHGAGVYSKWNSAKTDDYFGIIRDSNMPAIITEFAFVDSPDIADVDTYTEQNQEAKAISRAVCKFYGVSYKG